MKNIYEHLQDAESRFIFGKRLMYSLTQDERYIREIAASLPEAQGLKAEILRGNENFLFGAGNYGRAVFALAPHAWKGILDNNEKKWGTKIGGGTIVPPKTISEYPEARVFLAVRKEGARYQDEAAAQLKSLGVPSERIIRVDQIIESMMKRQYFDLPAMRHDADETFVDAGAYNGDTAKNFAEWAGTWNHIYAFEPDEANQERCQRALQALSSEKTTLFPCGAWKEKGELHFQSTGGWASTVTEDGTVRVPVSSMDEELVGNRVTFIKMDIEGSEREALEGAQNTIRAYRPKLAISIYHKPEDILELPKYVLSLHPDYRLYLRHYTLISSETVLYCL